MKRIGIFTSGGDAPGMNACIRAATRYGIAKGVEMFGIKHGYKGMIDDAIIPMDRYSVSGIIGRGGTILGPTAAQSSQPQKGGNRRWQTCKNMELKVWWRVAGMEHSAGQPFFSRSMDCR